MIYLLTISIHQKVEERKGGDTTFTFHVSLPLYYSSISDLPHANFLGDWIWFKDFISLRKT